LNFANPFMNTKFESPRMERRGLPVPRKLSIMKSWRPDMERVLAPKTFQT
jgi:hypothetical protein